MGILIAFLIMIAETEMVTFDLYRLNAGNTLISLIC
jgi:hypothetical protein